MLSMIKPRDLLPISQLIAQIADIYTLPGSSVSLRRYHDYESHLHYNHDHQHSSEWHTDTTQCYSINNKLLFYFIHSRMVHCC